MFCGGDHKYKTVPLTRSCGLAGWSVGRVGLCLLYSGSLPLQTKPLRIHLHKMYQINIKWLLVIVAELFAVMLLPI